MKTVQSIDSLLMLLLCVSLSCAQAPQTAQQTIEGKVTEIFDGDTIVVQDKDGKQYRVQLYGIDAPELQQVFGNKAKVNLSSLVAGKDVRVQYFEDDKQRVQGKVILGGRDINLEQIKAGLAWYEKGNDQKLSADDKRLYSEAEAIARTDKRGLWLGRVQQPPWEFRKEQARLKEERQQKAAEAANAQKAMVAPESKVDTASLDARINEAVKKAENKEATADDKAAAAAALIERGNLLYYSAQPQLYRRALEDYRRALQYQPDNAEAREKVNALTSIVQSMTTQP